MTKTCERCDGSGEIQETRPARMDELSDMQVKTLLYADLYRESGGEEAEERQKELRKMQQRGAGGPNTPNPRSVTNSHAPR